MVYFALFHGLTI